MSLQDICEVGGDINWMSPRHVMRTFSPTSPTGHAPSVNTLTNTTTTARPLPDPAHCVQQLQALLPSRPDIGFLRTDTDFLLRFLKVRNFQVAAAFQLLCGYYCYRQRERDLFKTTLGGAGVRAALCDGAVGVLPEKDSSGSAVMVILASNCDDTKCGLADVWGAVLLSLEKLSARGEEAGLVCVVDWSECPARLNADLSPKALRLVLDGLQDAFPLRLSGLHLLNGPWWTGTALRLARPFIKEKTRGRIHVHGNNLSSLHKHLPPRLLPAQLGGEGGEYRPAAWAEAVLQNTSTYSKIHSHNGDSGRILNSTAYTSSSKSSLCSRDSESSVKSVTSKTTDNVIAPASDCAVKNGKNSSISTDKTVKKIGDDEVENESADEEENEEHVKPIRKSFNLESLMRSAGSKKFQLAQMTEDSEGFTLKKIKSSSVEFSDNYSPTAKESNSIFSFSKSKSLSLSTDKENGGQNHKTNEIDDDPDEGENVYNFPKPPKTPPSFTTSITNSFTSNISRMGFAVRSVSKDGGSVTSYDRGQPSSHLLLSNDTVTPT